MKHSLSDFLSIDVRGFQANPASNVHASGIGQLQALPPVACLRLSTGKPTRRAVAMMRPNDMAIDEQQLLGWRSQRYDLKLAGEAR